MKIVNYVWAAIATALIIYIAKIYDENRIYKTQLTTPTDDTRSKYESPMHNSPEPTKASSQPTVNLTIKPSATSDSNCDPNYTPCVPNVSYDLNCSDIRFRVRVIGNDRYRLDKDGDGVGCETY